ncbi:type I restriction enzyme, S subunit [Enterococcus sp. DIV2371]|uniref:restriction endonuclease subunit S n=1 Tax=Enterococcus sp. DIV2371 TaxID=2774927 RepID=UPI003D26A5C7
MSNDAQPEIRFPGFTEDWEQRKLGTCVKFLNGKAYKQQELLDVGKYRVLRVGNFNTNDKWYYSNLELDENKYANSGDLLYLWATSFGPEIWNEEKVIYHYHIWKLEVTDNSIDKHYLYTWLLTDKERIKQSTNGSTMIHITKGSMEEREFQFPIDITEQQKIGSFFKQLDDTIALHQRKLDLLKETKKGFLQKMFPKNGAKVPEIRFPCFTGDWEERKLNEVSDIYDGTHQTPKYQDDGVMFLSVENIKTLTSNKFISRGAFESEFKIRPQKGDVLMTRIGDIGTANVVESDEDLAYYVSLALFKSEKLDPYFLQASIHAPFVQDQIWKRTLHIAFPKKINKNEIGQVPISIPKFEEQQKIGTFFKQLDDTIALHQRKLDLLKETKKGFLQKMFV